MSSVRKRLLDTLPDDENLRYAMDEQFLNTYIATQIRVLREDREMNQSDLAKAVRTGQSQISEMEGDYNSWSIRTLRKLARAFGVRLFVTFESWGELIPRMEGFKREELSRPKIEDDPVFKDIAGEDSTLGRALGVPFKLYDLSDTELERLAVEKNHTTMFRKLKDSPGTERYFKSPFKRLSHG